MSRSGHTVPHADQQSAGPGASRRDVLQRLATAAALSQGLPAAAQQRRPTDPLLLGVEASLEVSGLVVQLLRSLTRETGLPVRRQGGEGPALVAAAERGDFDVVITQAPQEEELTARRGLVHDRRLLAVGEYVLAGPGGGRGGDPARIRGQRDAAAAFARIAAAGARGKCAFVSTGGNAGAQLAEAALWKAAGPQPVGPWLRPGPPGPTAALELARQLRAYVLVERGVFAALAGPRTRGLDILAHGDSRLAAPYHIMRSFRVNHPGGKLLVNWLAGQPGHAVVAHFGRGYSPPAAQG